MINFDNITYKINHHCILDDVNIHVSSGSCCALIGHNGAGKTTLLKLLLGYIRHYQGQIYIKDAQQKRIDNTQIQFKQHIGFVPESLQFHQHQTGIELMRYAARIKNIHKADISEEISQRLQQMNIEFAQHEKIENYSKGMRQRLGLAQALLGNPKILIMDEPASGLDPDSRLLLYRQLQQHAQHGNTVLFSSHALNDIEPYIDQIILLNQGKVIFNNNIEHYRKNIQLEQQIIAELTINNTIEEGQDSLISALQALASVDYQNNQLLISTSFAHKKRVLSILAQHNNVLDINIYPPTLEQIYYALLENK